jgi:uncharacterized protein
MRPSLEKPTLRPAQDARPRAADEGLFLAADAHHHRGIGLLREQRRNDQRDAARDLAAESAARIFADEDDLTAVDIQPTGDGRHCLDRALRAGVHVDLPVLPIRHRTARLERLVAGVRRNEGLIEDQRGLLETRVNVAIRPVIRPFPHGQTALPDFVKLRLGPLKLLKCRGLPALRSAPDVSADSGIDPTGPQGI